MIAYCGLDCDTCAIFLATQKDDDQERAKTAKSFSEKFGWNLSAEDINCDGCRADGARLFNHCTQCNVRQCSRERELENCGLCQDYSCSKVETVFGLDPSAKTRLDRIRQAI